MFERFTDDARDAVKRAREESRRLGHKHIGTVHLLLALHAGSGAGGRALREHGLELDDLRERARRLVGSGHDPIDSAALATIGIDLDEVRRAVEAEFGEGALERGCATQGHIPFTPQAKKTLELSLRSALALKHKHICSGHILLGLLRATGDDNLALQVLAEAEVDADELRTTATRLVQAHAA